MPYKWTHFLTVAEELVEQSRETRPGQVAALGSPRAPATAYLRSAISRAYYAAYGTARDALRDEGMIVPSQESHLAVWQSYRDHPRPNRTRAQIETVGSRLNRQRRQADYDADVPGLPELAQRTIADAHRVLNWLAALDGR